jgi:hypothetical protein
MNIHVLLKSLGRSAKINIWHTNINTCYSKCHVTSNKAKSKLECAEVKFQTRGRVRGCGK